MSKVQTSTFTESALSDKVKDFLIRFKDKFGNYKYVEQIDEMMPKSSKYILVDYNDLVVEPELARIFSFDPDKIFDAFYSQHISNHTRGTALSLAIAREIMKLHDGNLSVESVPDEGSTFIFTLPASSVKT